MTLLHEEDSIMQQLSQTLQGLFHGGHFWESLLVLLIVAAAFVFQHYVFQRMLKSHAESLRERTDLLITNIKQAGSENLLFLQDQIRISGRTADLRSDGLDVLLERAKRAKTGAEALADLNDRKHAADAQRVAAARSLQTITDFLEPIDPNLKFNVLYPLDKRLYGGLTGIIIDLVLAVDPKRCGVDPKHDEQINNLRENLAHRFELFERHAISVIQPHSTDHV